MYDIVVDCTDNVPSRYLINDACVLANKPLVSGCAIGVEGQMSVYHYNDGPCYRCIRPRAPHPETVGNCSNSGVIGVVPGVIGCLQALECLKIAAGFGVVNAAQLVLFDGLTTQFKVIKLPKRKENCEVCGKSPKITQLINYEEWSKCRADDKVIPLSLLTPDQHINVQDYHKILQSGKDHVLIDVRKQLQFDICSLPNSINIPLSDLESKVTQLKEKCESKPIFVICRRGNDSQRAVKLLNSVGIFNNVLNITGGIEQWAKDVDPSFPTY